MNDRQNEIQGDNAVEKEDGVIEIEGVNDKSLFMHVTPVDLDSPEARADRITCSLQLHWQPFGEDPISFNCQYSEILEGEEELYIRRRFDLGEEWVQLDVGHIKNPKILYVENRVGQARTTQPTPEELQTWKDAVVEVALKAGRKKFKVFDQLTWGTANKYSPPDFSDIAIRCRKGTARINIAIVPG